MLNESMYLRREWRTLKLMFRFIYLRKRNRKWKKWRQKPKKYVIFGIRIRRKYRGSRVLGKTVKTNFQLHNKKTPKNGAGMLQVTRHGSAVLLSKFLIFISMVYYSRRGIKPGLGVFTTIKAAFGSSSGQIWQLQKSINQRCWRKMY